VDTLIAPDSTWLLGAILLIAAGLGLLSEGTALGARLSGAVITLLTTFVLSNLRIIPTTALVYDTVWSYLVPLAIPLLLFTANLRRIIFEAGPTLKGFFLGATGTVLGAVIAFHLIPLGEHAWQLAAIFSATYIGGSINYMGTAEAVGLRTGDLLTAGIATDNLMMTLYFLLLLLVPSLGWLQAQYLIPASNLPLPGEDSSSLDKHPRPIINPALHLPSLLPALALSSSLFAISHLFERHFNWAGGGTLLLIGLTIIIATLCPRLMEKLQSAHQLGILFMQIFFAAIGASANITVVLAVGPRLFFFAGLILTVHLTILLIGGKLFRLSLPEIIIASNANMGGPTTAAALAAARRWDTLIIPGILCGTLGYAIATFVGVALGIGLR
jgi:uncharacterized membrane protein